MRVLNEMSFARIYACAYMNLSCHWSLPYHHFSTFDSSQLHPPHMGSTCIRVYMLVCSNGCHNLCGYLVIYIYIYTYIYGMPNMYFNICQCLHTNLYGIFVIIFFLVAFLIILFIVYFPLLYLHIFFIA